MVGMPPMASIPTMVPPRGRGAGRPVRKEEPEYWVITPSGEEVLDQLLDSQLDESWAQLSTKERGRVEDQIAMLGKVKDEGPLLAKEIMGAASWRWRHLFQSVGLFQQLVSKGYVEGAD